MVLSVCDRPRLWQLQWRCRWGSGVTSCETISVDKIYTRNTRMYLIYLTYITYLYIYFYIYTCMYVCMYVCMYILHTNRKPTDSCVYIYTCMCKYIYNISPQDSERNGPRVVNVFHHMFIDLTINVNIYMHKFHIWKALHML